MSNVDGYRTLRGAMWALASGVAVIAAIVSYSHIYDLGIEHGGSGVPARLLPLSVDMLILVGELMLLHEADAKGRRFALAWALVWSGILATLAANVAYGYQFGVLGAVIWGWPAYSFILAAGGMVSVVKRGVSRDAGAAHGAAADHPAPEPETETAQAGTEVAPTARDAARAAYAASVKSGNPISERRLAGQFGIPRSQVRKLRAEVVPAPAESAA